MRSFTTYGRALSPNVRTLLIMLVGLILAPTVFVLLLGLQGVGRFNIDLFLWLNQYYWYPLANLVAFIELPAELFGLLFVVILAYLHHYELALCILIAIAIEVVYVTLTKDLTVLARPFVALNGINVAYYPKDYSFPSGHATGAFAVFSAWCFKEKKYYVPLLGVAALIALSRVYIGVHFPLDVIAGTMIGLIIGFSVARLDLTQIMHRLWIRFGQASKSEESGQNLPPSDRIDGDEISRDE
ncbi:MAG: phosphatase PAP2 family protein [Methanomassiliicoccales archaeon]